MILNQESFFECVCALFGMETDGREYSHRADKQLNVNNKLAQRREGIRIPRVILLFP